MAGAAEEFGISGVVEHMRDHACGRHADRYRPMPERMARACFPGNAQRLEKEERSLTALYLTGKEKIEREKGANGTITSS